MNKKKETEHIDLMNKLKINEEEKKKLVWEIYEIRKELCQEWVEEHKDIKFHIGKYRGYTGDVFITGINIPEPHYLFLHSCDVSFDVTIPENGKIYKNIALYNITDPIKEEFIKKINF
jgi:hypothetical protein